MDLGLDIVDGVGRLHLKGDGLARDCADAVSISSLWTLQTDGHTGLDEDLHLVSAATVSLPSST